MADHGSSKRRSFPLHLLPLVAIVAILAAVALLISNTGGLALPGGAKDVKSARFAGLALRPLRPAPPINLRNDLGRPVTLSQYRGKVVLVTFLYTHCPDVCPLIAAHLHTTLQELGPRAAGVKVIAVSADPRGDTPSTVATFLREHELTGQMQYLIGSTDQLGRTWSAWKVGSKRDAVNPTLVAHSALVYGVSASGTLTTIYPANFKPRQIIHDVPLLASR